MNDNRFYAKFLAIYDLKMKMDRVLRDQNFSGHKKAD
jgi:hypothetical protein